MTTKVQWTSPTTFRLYDERTQTKYQVGVPYANEVDFYSDDEMDDIIGHAIERFESECRQKSDHVEPTKDFQHGLGRTLNEIKASRLHRQEVGGPKFPLIVPKHLAGRKNNA